MNKIKMGISLEIIGISGALASTIALKAPYNYVLTTISCILLIVAFVSLLREKLRIKPKLELIQACKNLGIVKIIETEYYHQMNEKIANAKNIKIIADTAHALIINQETGIVKALENNAIIKILLAKVDSPYLKDLEILDGRKSGALTIEINQTLERLKAIRKQTNKGMLEIKFFSTHHRLTCVLCDDWCWLTLTIPPRRSYNSPSLEIQKTKENGLYAYCNKHFDEIWMKL